MLTKYAVLRGVLVERHGAAMLTLFMALLRDIAPLRTGQNTTASPHLFDDH